MSKSTKNRIRNLATSLAATAMIGGIALAQNDPGADGAAPGDAGSADPGGAVSAQAQADAGVTATFYDDLPANGGQRLGESGVNALGELDGQLSDARYAVLHVDERSYAFPVQSAGMAEGEVRLGVDGPAAEGTGQTDANAASAGAVPLDDVAETLEAGVTGQEDVVLAARQEGDAHVVTHIAPRTDVTDASTIDVTQDHVVVALDDGDASILDVRSDAETFGELQVEGDEGTTNVLNDSLWDGADGAPTGDGAAGDANGAANDAAGDPPVGAGDAAAGDAAVDEADGAANGADDGPMNGAADGAAADGAAAGGAGDDASEDDLDVGIGIGLDGN